MKCGSGLLAFVLLPWMLASAEAQSSRPNLEGMWSDPPSTAVGEFCGGWCTDAGIDYLNRLLDDPANDARPFGELSGGSRQTPTRRHIFSSG